MVPQIQKANRGVLIGMSCGGLQAVKQAARHPGMVSLLYPDAPVINLLSCPFGLGDKGTALMKFS